MRKVIMIGQEPKEESKGIEFTHEFTHDKCSPSNDAASEFNQIVYLGKCDTDGDMFAAYTSGCIYFYKGHLNNGTY